MPLENLLVTNCRNAKAIHDGAVVVARLTLVLFASQ
jgi:hypothetical protein